MMCRAFSAATHGGRLNQYQLTMGALVALAVLATGRVAAAQQIGIPVLQNAFLNPGTTVGVDLATGDSANSAGVAAAWAPSGGRFQVSGGVGVYDHDRGGSSAAWGIRAMIPAPRIHIPRLGVAAFGGVGGTSVSGVTEFRAPIGVSVGYRHALGAMHGVSGYVAPFYSWSHVSENGVNRSNGLLRISFGVDVIMMPGLGATLGYETGSTAQSGEPGPMGGIFGLGVSYALGHPR